MEIMDWKDWLMDVTFGDNPPCFVPYEQEKKTIVFGMNMIQDKCPGNLVGVIHSQGQGAVEAWIKKNPDWHKRFSSNGG